MEYTELVMVFGSNSDEEKILPGIIRVTKEIPGLKVVVHYASADNTPEKVDHVLYIPENEVVPVITGAGMSNVLTGIAKVRATMDDLIIGVPITDSATGGLSSLLSTSEKPPLNPVLTVGLDNTYAAAQIAVRFINSEYKKVVVVGNEGRSNFRVEDSAIEAVGKELKKLGIGYSVADLKSVGKDDLVITVFKCYNALMPPDSPRSDVLREVDSALREGRGIQIGVREKGTVGRWDHYVACLEGTDATGIVGIGRYENAAMVAAQIMGHERALEMIFNEKYRVNPLDPENDGKCVKLERHKGFHVVGGEVRKAA